MIYPLVEKPVRNSLKVPYKNYYLFYGRAGKTKGLPVLVNAIDLLAKQGKKPQFVLIISDHPKKERVKILEFIKARRLDNVIVLNQQPKDMLTAYILNAKAVIIPSTTEGFGYSAHEASQLNKPVIYSNNTSLNEVVKYGHHFNNGDILHLVKLLNNSDTGEHWERSTISIKCTTNRSRWISLYSSL